MTAKKRQTAARLHQQNGREHDHEKTSAPTASVKTFPQTTAAPVLLDHAEAAALLGMSDTTLKRLVRRGAIGPSPVRFSTRLVRWQAEELRQWAASGCPSRRDWVAAKGGGR